MRNLAAWVFPCVAAVLLPACGRQTPKTAFTFENPSFADGLTGWHATGNVKVAEVHDLPGYTYAAVLTYDGITPATLSQDVIVSRATWMAVSNHYAAPAHGLLQLSFSQGGQRPGGGGGAGGDPNWQLGGLSGSVQAGIVTVTWTVDNTGLPSAMDPSAPAPAPAGSFAKITGLAIDPNAQQPGPT